MQPHQNKSALGRVRQLQDELHRLAGIIYAIDYLSRGGSLAKLHRETTETIRARVREVKKCKDKGWA